MALAAPPKAKPAQKPKVSAAETTTTRGQLAGGPAVFGTTYSVMGANHDWNMSLDSAWYDVVGSPADGGFPQPNQKYLYTHWRFKNTATGSNSMQDGGFSGSLVFADGTTQEVYFSTYRLSDLKPLTMEFRPGQGIDDAVSAVLIPRDAKVTKIVLNESRVYVKDEKVMRYFIADGDPAVKADPKNVIAPFPKFRQDPSDASGVKPLTDISAEIGKEYTISIFALTVESLSTASKFGPMEADADHTILVATVNLRNRLGIPMPMGMTGIRNGLEATVVDGDDESESVSSVWYKNGREEAVTEHDLKPGETYRVRVAFAIRKPQKPLKAIRLREDEYKADGLVFDASKVLGQ